MTDENNGDDGIVDAELVEDGETGENDGGRDPVPVVPPDTVLTPCHHGCTCGLHQQVVYGSLVEEHEPTLLDHGEMGLLTAAVGDASRMLHGFHNHLQQLRAAAARTHGAAGRALRDLAVLLDSDAVRRARAERDRVEEAYADLTPAERQPPPTWLLWLWPAAAVVVGLFDAVFFQQNFLDIMNTTVNDPWWKRDIGFVVALMLAVGMIVTGRILSGPLWRLRHSRHRPPSPDEPRRRWVLVLWVIGLGAVPAALFFVLGWWASFRGQAAAAEHLNPLASPVPPPIGVTLLLLSLSLTVVVLEVLAYHPYHSDLRRADKALSKVRGQVTAGFRAASVAVDDHQIAWRDLRSARDEVIAFVQAELARPWETLILPARLRHGKAGGTSAEPKPKPDVTIELVPETDQVRISYQIFDGMVQPQPGPGPLAEVVRAVIEYDPQALKDEQKRLEKELLEHLGEPAEEAS